MVQIHDYSKTSARENVEKALNKVVLYNFDVDKFLNSIESIKSTIFKNS